ncbi:phosphatase PAP2 family protein [Flavobacterium sp. Sd200]|uniref:phosphatase PAP2 family protein n=1 Tax=Flavobacterium sp. Sd200 TaxID=2692211 RepID=UPI00136C3293|nr:phosphatase PAP2 family protein [Flavobacterium sp. Sd200]MXN92961.1 phosphatase PAP2 family protein [Flavobacterium sp. Sd200]
MKKIIPVVLFFISLFQSVSAQTDSLAVSYADTLPPKKIWSNFKTDAVSVGGGFIYALSQPVRWEKKDYYRLAGTVAAVGILYTVDQQTSDFFTKNEEGAPALLKNFGWYFGSPQINYGVTGSIYLAGLLTNHEKLRRTGVLMITSASVSGFIQQVSKSVTGRARPQTGFGKNHFRPFGGDAGYRSFPSGHTVLSVTTMYSLSKQFESPWLKGTCYVVGAIPPLSRLWEGAHWLTDVVLSGIISVAVVECVDRYLDEKKHYGKKDPNAPEEKPKKISWNLRAGPNTVGLVGVF